MTDIDTAIPEADHCYRCGYNLHTIANDQPCPECGLLAERSRRVTDELHNTRPRWLANLSRGVWLLVAALCALPVLSFAVQWGLSLYYMHGGAITYYRALASVSAVAPPLLAAIMLLAGIFLLTRAEGYPPADTTDRGRRRALRILAFVPVAAIGAEACLYQWLIFNSANFGFDYTVYERLNVIVSLIFTLPAVPIPLLLFYQLRSLARRARSAHLAEHCAIVGVGTALALVYVAVMQLILYLGRTSGTYWMERSSIALMVLLTASVLTGLFTLWSLYLLIRFAISFRKAARQLRAQWKRHDRAAEGPWYGNTSETPPPIAAASTDVTSDCYRCGYNLHTIADDQPCPECGLLAERSRRITDELHNTRPRWLASIARGVWLLLAAILLAFAWFVTIPPILAQASQAYARTWRAGVAAPPRVQFMIDYSTELISSGFYVAGLLLLVGCWQLTAAEGYPPADRTDRWRRIAIRILALLPLAAFGVEHFLSWRGRSVGRAMTFGAYAEPSVWEFILPWTPFALLAIAGGALPLLIFFHLRSLAKRARSAHLAEHCAIAGFGTTLAVVYFSGVIIFRTYAYDGELDWIAGTRTWLYLLVAAAVAGFLFLFWSLYLLTRFAFSFLRAARQLRAQWQMHDRARA
jgi:hypothetical protein